MKTTTSKYFDYQIDDNGNPYLEVHIKGNALLRLAATNKGTAFSERERIELDLDGLLPPHVVDIKQQVDRLYRNFLQQPDAIAKYQFLRSLQERSEYAYYALLELHLEEMMPIIYTPTVGKAVQEYSSLYQFPRGITLSANNVGRADAVMENYPWGDVRMIVATDSSAILGIGDQGHGGLAICIGKLALYTAGCGVSPFHTMPVNLDVGTDRNDLLQDPNYLGIHHKRLRGDQYFDLVDKFVSAVQKRWPKAVIQWEDFAKNVAFEVLDRYKDKIPCFNDDIQGTGAVILAGLLAACHQKGEKLSEQKVVVVGAGAGGVGVARAIRDGMMKEGLSEEDARRQLFVMDGAGLVVEGISRDDYKLSVSQYEDTYAEWKLDGELPQLMEVIEQGQPTVLLGLTGVSGLFSQTIIETMAKNTQRPIIFPLSNPTANCEAIPQDILAWTDGNAIVASGSPFDDVIHKGKTHIIGQGNNAFIFPGLGFATIIGKCRQISDAMVLESAYALADYTINKHIDNGRIFPPVNELQEASVYVAARVLKQAMLEGSSSRNDLPGDLPALIDFIYSRMWYPDYLPFKYSDKERSL